MKSLKFSAVLILVVFLSGGSLSKAQEASQCLALITGLNGNVFLKKTGKTEFVKTFKPLPEEIR
jgi:hypothetical protein